MIEIPQIYLWTLGSALFACIGMLIAHKLVQPIDLEKHQASLDATLNIVGTLVSILLGMLVAASLSNYQSLESDIEAEATNVSEICRLSFGLPLSKQREILEQCLNYCNLVVNDEWPAMSKGDVSPKAVDVYAKLLKDVVTLNPTTNGETNIQNALITAIQSLGDYRRHRILWLNNTWDRKLMPVLLMCSLIVLAFAYLYIRQGSILLHSFLVCFVATALGANLGMIFLLSHPFTGDWAIQPKGFETDIKLIEKYGGLPK